MKKLHLYLLCFLCITILISCKSKKNSVRVSETNFSDIISVQTTLSFSFTRDIAEDSLLNILLENDFLNIKPDPEGKIMWITKRKFIYIPENGFKPCTDYVCDITNNILKYNPDFELKGQTEYKFHTPYLSVNNIKAFWTIPEKIGEEPQVKFTIDFNQEIIPSEIAERLEILINNEKQTFSLISNDISSKMDIVIPGLKAEDKDIEANITIKKGVTANKGSIRTTDDFIKEFDIPSPFKLEITDVQANHDGSEGIITIATSQQVNEKNIEEFIKITPWVKYSVDIQASYFTIKSEYFDVSEKYDLVIKEGLSGKIGGKLKYDYSQPISFAELKPTIFFVDQKEFYLSGKGYRNIEAAIINVPKVKIVITKIYENNIVNYIKDYNFRYYSEYYDYDYYGYYYRTNASQFGDIVFEKEIETKELPRKGNHRLLNLDFEDKLAEYKGIYVIEINSTDQYWLRANKMVSVSDIGLIVKEGKNKTTVFVNSISKATPLADVEIKFIGNNNQINNTTKTNADGVAVYEFSELKAQGFKTNVITAKLGNDFNFIPLQKTQVATSRFDVGGKRENPSGIEAFIYGDRDIYRPGEKVNISAIVRDYKWNNPGEIPLILEFITPNGKTLKSIKKILNQYGSFETEIELNSSAMTGSYVANIYTTNKVLIGSKIIKIEEFVPDRIKVDVKLNKTEYKTGDNIIVDVEALNFFGPPAANRNYEIELSTKRKYFYPKENKEYNYSIEGGETYFANILRENKTNEEGKAQEIYEIPKNYKNMGILQSDLFVTVFDETGRPVNRLSTVNIYTQDVFYGIKYSNYYVKTGNPIIVDLIAVDKNGKALTGIDAVVKLIKHEYKTVLSKSGSYFRYRSEKVEKEVEIKRIKINETSTTYSFIPDLSGQYEIRLSATDVYTYVKRDIYAYGWGSTTYSSFKVNNEGQIDFQLDKEKYNVGEKANVLLKVPFTGKILVTIENNKVLDYYFINTDKRAASIELDIKEDYLPNVYITATLFRPHEVTDLPLTVAHGFQPIIVEKAENKLPVEILAVNKSRSNTKQKIKVKSQPNCALTIGVVDEGILQITGFQTPDPYDFFYQKRALEVNTCDIYPYIFPELEGIKSYTGGGEPGMDKRVNPLQNKRIKLVALWSGIIETDTKGEAEFEIDIPQFSGDLRIMAIVYKNNHFGSAHSNMKVADPLVISTALPRFLSPKDSVEIPVILTNTTENETNCKTKIIIEGPVEIIGNNTQNIKIPSNTEKEVQFKVYAQPVIGEAKITIEAEALNEKFLNITDITIRPASPLQKRNASGIINAGENAKFSMEIDDFINSSIDKKVIVSKNPLVQFTNSLDYLVRYPYGCVEQTVSTAFPQLYFNELINIVYKEKRAGIDAVSNVQKALDRIKLMQLHNGGLTFWPGTGFETWWGSVYAAHFTIEAKKAGYEIDESFLNKLLKYIESRLRKKEVFIYYYNFTHKREIAPKEVPYSLYVLALAGEKPISTMNYYKAHLDQLSLDGKYLLAAAYALTGDHKKYKEIVPPEFSGEKSNPSFGGSFYSYIRDEAIALNALLEIDPENGQIGEMAKHISEYLKNRRYLNTQERTFCFLAMGKIAKIAAESDVKGNIKIDGKVISNFDNNSITLTTQQIKGNEIVIETQGNGKLYYFWEAEGISKEGKYFEEDSYIKVRKNFYDRNGNYVAHNKFKQNDLVLVEIVINGATNTYVENVVISDILPAGFEIENPRITVLPPGMKWPNSRSNPTYQDIRDDRINLFVNVSQNIAYYYYLVRCVSRGTFQMGPIGADAMYNGEYHSYNGGGIVKITK